MSDRPDPDVESFLLLLAARRSPRTVDAYRRDLASCAASLEGPVGAVTTEELEAWLAAMRADGRAPSTIARRLAATADSILGQRPRFRIDRTGRRITIQTEYSDSVDLPFFKYTFLFRPRAEAPL